LALKIKKRAPISETADETLAKMPQLKISGAKKTPQEDSNPAIRKYRI